ncbi:hypothetical protein [Mesorhizobium sp. M1396]|uniref:hypothetical protein n=1 Tax=Mesorhizobium sp. M1396 TaxID=2957095 RepID=UPI0033399D8D
MALRSAFGIEVDKDRRLFERLSVVQRVDDDDSPCVVSGDCIVLSGDCGDIDAALPADQIVARPQPELVFLQSRLVLDRDDQSAVRIGNGARTMSDTERALAGANFDLRRIELG